MKTIAKSLGIVLILGATLFTSCKKKTDDTTTSTTSTGTMANVGGLKFVTKLTDGTLVPGATINIAPSQSDLDNDNFVATRITDSNGAADFGKLNAGNYYYKASSGSGFSTKNGNGIVQIQAGQNVAKDIVLN